MSFPYLSELVIHNFFNNLFLEIFISGCYYLLSSINSDPLFLASLCYAVFFVLSSILALPGMFQIDGF